MIAGSVGFYRAFTSSPLTALVKRAARVGQAFLEIGIPAPGNLFSRRGADAPYDDFHMPGPSGPPIFVTALPRIDDRRRAFCYERLLDAPEAVLGRLAGALDLPDPDRFVAGAAQVRRGAPPLMDAPAGQEGLARTARDLYAAIADKAL